MISDLKLEEIKVKLENKSVEIRSSIDKIIESTKDPEKSMILIRNLAFDVKALEAGQRDLIEELFKRTKK